MTKSPRLYVDNVSLRVAPGPVFGFLGERRLGVVATYGVETWAPSTPFAVRLSTKLLSPPIKVLGWLGEWSLDPVPAILVVTSATNSPGVFAGALSVPNSVSLDGLPLHWQGLHVGVNGKILGNASLQAFYAPLRSGGVIEESSAVFEQSQPSVTFDGCRFAYAYNEGTKIYTANLTLDLDELLPTVRVHESMDVNSIHTALSPRITSQGESGGAIGLCGGVFEGVATAQDHDIRGIVYDARGPKAMSQTVFEGCPDTALGIRVNGEVALGRTATVALSTQEPATTEIAETRS